MKGRTTAVYPHPGIAVTGPPSRPGADDVGRRTGNEECGELFLTRDRLKERKEDEGERD